MCVYVRTCVRVCVHVRAHVCVKNAVTRAKDGWIQKTALAADVDKTGHGQWHCVKQLQMVYCSLQSVRTLMNMIIFFLIQLQGLLIRDGHFTKVFNVVSEFLPWLLTGCPCWRFGMILMFLLH